MSLRLGDTAPNFKATTTAGEIDFYDYLGDSWGVLFSHPADFTPVCTTELGKTALLNGEFAKRNVKVLALSVDPLDKHKSWIGDINETQGCDVTFPIIADEDKTVANLYGMIHPNASETFTVRSLFVIGPDGHAYMAFYTMERQPDGSWRISGCHLVELEDESV